MLLLVRTGGGGEGAGRSGRRLGEDRAARGWVSGIEAMPPITIIFHHPNYIVECTSAAACVHPVLLLGKERGTET